MDATQGLAAILRDAEEAAPQDEVGDMFSAAQDEGCSIDRHSAATIASSPSVSAAGPGCRISGDLISTMRSLRTAGISFQPGRFLILSGTTFLPHHDARITSGAAARTTSGEMMRSLAAC